LSYEKELKAVEQNRDFLIDTLRRMIQVNTSNPPGMNYDNLADVTEILKELGEANSKDL
jgi:hypothetical protein